MDAKAYSSSEVPEGRFLVLCLERLPADDEVHRREELQEQQVDINICAE